MFSEHPRHERTNGKCYRTFDLQRHCVSDISSLVSNLVLPGDELVCWLVVPEEVVSNGRSQAHIMLCEGMKCLCEVRQMRRCQDASPLALITFIDAIVVDATNPCWIVVVVWLIVVHVAIQW